MTRLFCLAWLVCRSVSYYRTLHDWVIKWFQTRWQKCPAFKTYKKCGRPDFPPRLCARENHPTREKATRDGEREKWGTCAGLLTNTRSNMVLRSKLSKSYLGTHAFRLKLLQRHKTKAYFWSWNVVPNFRATKECFFSDSAARVSVLRTYSVSNLPLKRHVCWSKEESYWMSPCL